MSKTLAVTSSAMPTLLGGPALELRRIDGQEGLSELFSYTLTLSTPDNPMITKLMAANVDFKKLVGKELTVKIGLDGKGFQSSIGSGTREISGLVTRARFVRSEDRRGVYEVVIEPWLTLTTRSSDFKIFQKKSALDIVMEVLSDYSFSVVKRTNYNYPIKDFQVQYGETDFAFINRLMEEWGMYYFFEHEGEKHTMIIVDDVGAHKKSTNPAYQEISYFPPGYKIDEEHLNYLDFTETLETGAWVTDDFDFKQPRAKLQHKNEMPRNTGNNKLEMYSWPSDISNPEKPTDSEEGRHLARIRMEEAGSAGQRATGSGNLRGMLTGTLFTLKNFPQEKYNNLDYLILSTSLSISDSGSASGQGEYNCNCNVVLQPADHIYRTPRTTPLPRTTGPQTAVVVGPAGREIWTDEYGRVKLSFHWNRYCTKDENSSCWVRVSYPWAGNNFGGINIPRIGQEVIVDFENGSPDRPVVIGRVYNALNMPPWELPANATQSGFLSRSSESGAPANANAFMFEDKKGVEEVWLHAEKDFRIEVENDQNREVGHDETNHIKNDRTETVDGHEKINILKTRTEEVGEDETLTVHGSRSRTVDGTETETVGKAKMETIALGHMQNVGLGKMVNVGAAYNINVGGAMLTVVGALRNDTTALSHSDQVGVNRSTKIGKSYTIEVGDTFTVKVGASSLVMKSDGTITLNGRTIDVVGDTHVGVESKMIDLN